MAPFNVVLLQNVKDLISTESPSANTIHTLEKGFVDLNLELNENVNTKIQKKSVSFTSDLYNLSEGYISDIYIQLDSPSVLGLEEVELIYVNSNSSSAIINKDLSVEGTDFAYPLRLSWDIGEQIKKVSITGITDYDIESIEEFYFELKNFINCNPSDTTKATIKVSNVDNFPFVYMQPYNDSFSSAKLSSDGTYKLFFDIPEDDQLNFKIALSSPSVNGLEEVEVIFVNQTTGIKDYKIKNQNSPLGVNNESSYTKELNNLDGFMISETFKYLKPNYFPAKTVYVDYNSYAIQDSLNQIQSTTPTSFITKLNGEYTIFYRGIHNLNINITPVEIIDINGSYSVKLLVYKNDAILQEYGLYFGQINSLNTNVDIPFSFNVPINLSISDKLTFKLKFDLLDTNFKSNYIYSAEIKLALKTIDSYLDILKTLGKVVRLKWDAGEREKSIQVDVVDDNIKEPIETFMIGLQNAKYSNIVSSPTSVSLISTGRFPDATAQIQS